MSRYHHDYGYCLECGGPLDEREARMGVEYHPGCAGMVYVPELRAGMVVAHEERAHVILSTRVVGDQTAVVSRIDQFAVPTDSHLPLLGITT